jgi:hypothetical protein
MRLPREGALCTIARSMFVNRESFARASVHCTLALVVGLCACGGDKVEQPVAVSPTVPSASTPPVAPPVAAEAREAGAAEPTATSSNPTAPIAIVTGTPIPDPTPRPSVKFIAPTRDLVIPTEKAADFVMKYAVKDWPLEKGGNHCHIMLDGHYKAALWEVKDIKLGDLVSPEGEKAAAHLTEGMHVLAAFLSRPSHESVKTKEALVVIPFWIGKKDPAAAAKDPTKKPMLVYSRPKGTYKGEKADHILIDFQLANLSVLGPNKEHVNFSITGPGAEQTMHAKIEKYGTPLFIDNLRNGDYQLQVDLVDGSDKVIEGPWNSAKRTITIARDAKPEPKKEDKD